MLSQEVWSYIPESISGFSKVAVMRLSNNKAWHKTKISVQLTQIFMFSAAFIFIVSNKYCRDVARSRQHLR